MNTQEVAEKVVELVRKQAWHQALDTLYDKDIVSVEAHASEGESAEKRGIDEVRGKNGLVGQCHGSSQLQSERTVRRARPVCGAVRCRRDGQEFEKANAIIGSWRLRGEERKDRPRRVSAVDGERIKPI